MSYTDENGNKCRCSRNRKCGLHAQAAKRMARVARPVIEARRVEVGIEALRAKYANKVAENQHDYPQYARKPAPKNKWVRPS